jgi:hypothetical protein
MSTNIVVYQAKSSVSSQTNEASMLEQIATRVTTWGIDRDDDWRGMKKYFFVLQAALLVAKLISLKLRESMVAHKSRSLGAA